MQICDKLLNSLNDLTMGDSSPFPVKDMYIRQVAGFWVSY